jgi:hypothetical protein
MAKTRGTNPVELTMGPAPYLQMGCMDIPVSRCPA